MSGFGRTALHALAHFLRLEAPETQTTLAERVTLRDFARGRKRVVEIGIYEGVSTRLIAESLPVDAEFYAIDPFVRGRAGICWSEVIAGSELRRGKVRHKVQIVRELSHRAAPLIGGTFDFIFIDGDHSWEGISRDWADWAGRIDPGGVALLHDTHVPKHNPHIGDLGSHRFFQEVIAIDPRYELLNVVDSLSVLRRV
jgi:predicted O-methyltransferase YrrM